MNTANYFVLENGILTITPEGDFNRDLAYLIQEELNNYQAKKIERIIFNLNKINFLASSGLRVIIYTKEEITPAIEVVVTDASDIVISVIQMSGVADMLNVKK